MDSTFALNSPTDFRSARLSSAADTTGSMMNNKNKFMQFARRLRHTLNHNSAHTHQTTSGSPGGDHKKRLFHFSSGNSTRSAVSSDCTLTVPAVGALAVAAAAAVAAPAPNAIVSFAQLNVATNSLRLSTRSAQPSPNSSSPSDLRHSTALEKHSLRPICGICLPTHHHHPRSIAHHSNGGQSCAIISSNGSSRASSISSHNSSSTCSSTGSGLGQLSSTSGHELSLLQTLALCSLELAAPALHHCSLPPTSADSHRLLSSSCPPSSQNAASMFDSSCTRFESLPDPFRSSVDPPEFIQLSGHRDGFRQQSDGRVWKKISETASNELIAYERLNRDPFMQRHVATFYGERQDADGQRFVELADLLRDFRRPAWLMDVKMGSRTFLEKEVSNAEARSDLFDKMEKTLLAGGPEVAGRQLLTEEECEQRALTKLRYMSLREQLSSSSTLGFRVEAYKVSSLALVHV
jgi:hypothetical protein